MTGPQAEYSLILDDYIIYEGSDCHLYSVYIAMGCASLFHSKQLL